MARISTSCDGNGDFAGGWMFYLRNFQTAAEVTSWPADANTRDSHNFQPTSAGRYYIEVREYNTGSTQWSFTLDQNRCMANCPNTR